MILSVLGLLCWSSARADEGMWMVNAIDAALEKKMQERGLKLAAGEIYNADAEGACITDAVVSLDFGCTGSIISDNGLLITNHHCAYGDVHALSTPEHNYLEEGFWAMQSSEEKNIKGKGAYFLKKVLDITEEVEAVKAEQRAQGKSDGMRRVGWLIEKKYDAETGLETMVSSMWGGSKYYLAVYQVYKDVRLVAAPPVSSAAFGGDIDNWEWPQHKCDFAMYRIYTAPDGSPAEYAENNIPMKPQAKLKISLEGYKPGDYAMVIGYPGRTNRYSSVAENAFESGVELPISNRLRGEQMAIIKKWMDADPEIRLKYADHYFSLSNVQELNSGMVACIDRFDVLSQKREIEKELQEWIESDAARKEKWGAVLADLQAKHDAVADDEIALTYYRETLIRGTRLGKIINKINSYRNEVLKMNGIKPKKPIELKGQVDPVEEACCRKAKFRGSEINKVIYDLIKEYEKIDLRVEKDLFIYSALEYLENVNPSMMGEYQKEIKAKKDVRKAVEDIWNKSFVSDLHRFGNFVQSKHTVYDYLSDPLVKFFQDTRITRFNESILKKEGKVRRFDLDREFTHALYQMRLEKGIVQYPDANSTMRITYGTVGTLKQKDGVIGDWKTTPAGILEKYNPSDYDFSLNDRQYLLYRKGDWGRWGFGPEGKDMHVDFLTDCDITGGNSGSPVMNAKGELIGLAFDGNKESLASDIYYTPEYNKCVCVDIRFVLWTLDRYAGMERIIKEIGL